MQDWSAKKKNEHEWNSHGEKGHALMMKGAAVGEGCAGLVSHQKKKKLVCSWSAPHKSVDAWGFSVEGAADMGGSN